MIQRACASNMTSVIGCLTPSEAFSALHYGASALKIFPAGEMGPEYIAALRAVLPPGTRLWAVGGITPDNLPAFLTAGCCGAGLGSDLYRAGQSRKKPAAKHKGLSGRGRHHPALSPCDSQIKKCPGHNWHRAYMLLTYQWRVIYSAPPAQARSVLRYPGSATGYQCPAPSARQRNLHGQTGPDHRSPHIYPAFSQR